MKPALLLLFVSLVMAFSTTPAAQGSGPLLRFSQQVLPSAAPDPTLGHQGFAVVQLDFTGTREIVHLAGSTLEIFFNPQRGPRVSSVARFTVDNNSRGLVTGDFDGDRHRDIAVIGFEGGRIQLLFGNGRGAFLRRATIATPPEPVDLTSADFDGDGRPDFAYAFALADRRYAVRTLLNRGRGRFDVAADTTVSNFVERMIASDLDGDGRADLVLAHFSDVVTVLLNDGGARWQPAVRYRTASRPEDVVAVDLNRDGVRDLVTANFDSQTVGVLRGTGGGRFGTARQFPMERGFTGRLTPTRLAVGDVTGDGVLDVMLANGSLLAGRGDGTFAAPLQFDMTGRAIALHDLDGDGRLDILLDHEFTSPPHVRLAFNRAIAANRPPVPGGLLEDATVPFGEDATFDGRGAFDPDGHLVLYDWRDELGRLVGTSQIEAARRMPGRYAYTLRLHDTFGGETILHPTLTVTGTAPPRTEVVLHAARASVIRGAWRRVADGSAASGARLHHPDAGAQRPRAPLARPANYFELTFRPNSQRVYTLSMRGRADGNSWRNDSVFVQFSSAIGFDDEPRWRIGTTEGLVYSVERCVSCRLAAWGWNFDGIPNETNIGDLILFANDGPQTIRIQSREDGVSIDQIVLSSWTYQGGRFPGADKRDTIILPRTQ